MINKYSHSDILKTFKIGKTKLDRYLAEANIEPISTKDFKIKSMMYMQDIKVVAKYYNAELITQLMQDKGVPSRT